MSIIPQGKTFQDRQAYAGKIKKEATYHYDDNDGLCSVYLLVQMSLVDFPT